MKKTVGNQKVLGHLAGLGVAAVVISAFYLAFYYNRPISDSQAGKLMAYYGVGAGDFAGLVRAAATKASTTGADLKLVFETASTCKDLGSAGKVAAFPTDLASDVAAQKIVLEISGTPTNLSTLCASPEPAQPHFFAVATLKDWESLRTSGQRPEYFAALSR